MQDNYGTNDRRVNRTIESLRNALIELIEEKIVRETSPDFAPSVPPAVCAHFIAFEIFGLLKWWLDRNMPYSPEEMDKMFHDLVGPGIANVLAKARPHPMSA